MSKKAIYKHKKTGDLFAIETDEDGKIVSSCGPLLSSDIRKRCSFLCLMNLGARRAEIRRQADEIAKETIRWHRK